MQAVRLVTVRPSSSLVLGISPIAVLLALVVGMPTVMALETRIVKGEQDQLGSRIAELSALTQRLAGIAEYDWTRAASNIEATKRQVDTLRALTFPEWLTDGYMWRAAGLLGRDGDLERSTIALTDRLAGLLDTTAGPRITVQQHRYNPLTNRWESHPDFDQLSTATVDYFREATRLLRETERTLMLLPATGAAKSVKSHLLTLDERTDPQPTSSGPAGGAAQRESKTQDQVRSHLQRWETGWLAPVLVDGAPAPSLSAVLQMTLPGPLNSELNAARVAELMNLPRRSADALATGPCQSSSYSEGSYDYFRVDCDAYALSEDLRTAQLLVQMRLVYRALGRVGAAALPTELYYIFPVPSGRELNDYQQVAMQELHDAIVAVYGPVAATNRGGPPSDGFPVTIGGPARQYQVRRPQPERGQGFVAVQTGIRR